MFKSSAPNIVAPHGFPLTFFVAKDGSMLEMWAEQNIQIGYQYHSLKIGMEWDKTTTVGFYAGTNNIKTFWVFWHVVIRDE